MNETELIAFALFFSMDGDGVDDIPNQWERWQVIYKPVVSQEHSGDCRQEPWTCLRCLVEGIYREAQAIAAVRLHALSEGGDAPPNGAFDLPHAIDCVRKRYGLPPAAAKTNRSAAQKGIFYA